MIEQPKVRTMAAEKMIKISTKTYERLKDYGKFGDTFDAVLARVLDDNEALKLEVKTLKYPLVRPVNKGAEKK